MVATCNLQLTTGNCSSCKLASVVQRAPAVLCCSEQQQQQQQLVATKATINNFRGKRQHQQHLVSRGRATRSAAGCAFASRRTGNGNGFRVQRAALRSLLICFCVGVACAARQQENFIKCRSELSKKKLTKSNANFNPRTFAEDVHAASAGKGSTTQRESHEKV